MLNVELRNNTELLDSFLKANKKIVYSVLGLSVLPASSLLRMN